MAAGRPSKYMAAYCDEVIARNEPPGEWRQACATVAANVLNELNGTVHHPVVERQETKDAG